MIFLLDIQNKTKYCRETQNNFDTELNKTTAGGIAPAASLSLAVQRNILLAPFTGINAVDVVLYVAMLH